MGTWKRKSTGFLNSSYRLDPPLDPPQGHRAASEVAHINSWPESNVITASLGVDSDLHRRDATYGTSICGVDKGETGPGSALWIRRIVGLRSDKFQEGRCADGSSSSYEVRTPRLCVKVHKVTSQ